METGFLDDRRGVARFLGALLSVQRLEKRLRLLGSVQMVQRLGEIVELVGIESAEVAGRVADSTSRIPPMGGQRRHPLIPSRGDSWSA
jgi:hypothetical protein